MNPVVEIVPVFEDNYSFVLTLPGKDRAVVVDPGDGEKVWRLLKEKGYGIEAILATHHHFDHVAGIEFLCDKTPVDVYCFKDDLDRVPGAGLGLEDEEEIERGGLRFRTLHVPGHTSGHVVYVCGNALLAGDTLFLGGCGRLFEGSPEQMFRSLYDRILPLPEETRVFAAHEYTVHNRSFCLSIESENAALQRQLDESKALRRKNLPTVPGSLKTEKETNTFLRCREPAVVRAVRAKAPDTSDDPVSVFAAVRRMRDVY
ncbi:MAG: hydroxyacylglutathione hydrolase [Thermodesulfobacteriota bacterium]